MKILPMLTLSTALVSGAIGCSDGERAGANKAVAIAPSMNTQKPKSIGGGPVPLGTTDSPEATGSPIVCPAGAELIGEAPPKGYEQLCVRSDFLKEKKLLHPRSWFLETAKQDQGRHGAYRYWAAEKILLEEGQYTHGKQTGQRTRWHDNGQMSSRGRFKAGGKHGKWTQWRDTGEKKWDKEYTDAKRSGTWTKWHANGQKAKVRHYQDGEPIGTWTTWYENGQKRSQGEYKEGKGHGVWTRWHDNGQKKYEGAPLDHDDLVVDSSSRCWDRTGKAISCPLD